MTRLRHLACASVFLVAIGSNEPANAQSSLPVDPAIEFSTATTELPAGSIAVFSLKVASKTAYDKYEINFGDKVETWDGKRLVVHPYPKSGGTNQQYTAYVVRNIVEGKRLLPRSRSEYVRLTVTAPPPPKLTLSVAPNPVRAGMEVTIKGTISSRPPGPTPLYQFTPGDGTGPVQSTRIEFPHTYAIANSYQARVELVGTDVATTASVVVEPAPQLTLSVSQSRLPTNQPFQFQAQFNASTRGLFYRFHLEENSPGNVSEQPQIEHAYPTAGPRKVYAEIGRGAKTKKDGISLTEIVATSNVVDITVGEPARIQISPRDLNLREGDSARFSVTMSDGSSVNGFQFAAGDYKKEKPPAESSFSHRYDHPGTFTASVSLNDTRDEITVVVLPLTWLERLKRFWDHHPSGWIRWLLFFGAAATATWGATKLWPPPPVPKPPLPVPVFSLVPRIDPQPRWRPVRQVPDARYSIRLYPHLNRGEFAISNTNPPLIRTERKSHV